MNGKRKEEGRLTVRNVTARRRQEIASIVERLPPERRAARPWNG
ncbi:hypothetical protein [Streptomyces sp. NPDC020607]